MCFFNNQPHFGENFWRFLNHLSKMPPHKCEEHIKAILSDRSFDFDKFLLEKYEDFWINVSSYLDLYAIPQDAGIFRSVKRVNLMGLTDAISALVTRSSDSHYTRRVLTEINHTFQVLLHPESPETYRLKSTTILFRLFTVLNDEKVNILNVAFGYIIPYVRFARNEEKSLFMELFYKIQPIIQQQPDEGNVKSAESQLTQFLKFLANNWKNRSDQCCRMFYEHVFAIIFKKQAEAVLFPTQKYGFRDPVPDFLQNFVYDFFRDVFRLDNDVSVFAQMPSMVLMFILVLRESVARGDFQNNTMVINMLTKILDNKKMVTSILETKETEHIYYELPEIAIQAMSTVPLNNEAVLKPVLRTFNDFCRALFSSFFIHFQNQPALEKIQNLFKKHSVHKTVLAVFLMNLFPFAIEMGSNDLWSVIEAIVCSKDLFTSIAIRYAQFLAIYVFPSLVELDPQEAIRSCEEYKQSNHKPSKNCDWVASNINLIIESPGECPVPKSHIEFEASNEIVQICNILVINSIKSDDRVTTAKRFIDTFRHFKTKQKIEEQRRLFAPFLSFCSVLEELRYLPPGVNSKKNGIFDLVSGDLFYGVISLNDNTLKLKSLIILEKLINNFEMKSSLSKEILTQWYTSLLLSMVSDVPDLRHLAFVQAVKSIELGFPGSTVLGPLLLSVVEEKIMKVEVSHLTFITSIALFSFGDYGSLATPSIVSFIENNDQLFCSNALSIIKKEGKNFKGRIMEVLSEYHNSAKGRRRIGSETIEWTSVLPCYQAIIAEELVLDKPDIIIIVNILKFISEAVGFRSMEALVIVRTCAMYSEKFIQLFPKEYQIYVESIIDIVLGTNSKDGAEWLCKIIQSIVVLVIYSSNLIVVSQKFVMFCHFLSDFLLKKNITTEFPEELYQQIDLALLTISSFIKAYPFPSSIHFPSCLYLSDINESKPSVFLCQNQALLHNSSREGMFSLKSHILTGQFCWNFRPCCEHLYSDSNFRQNVSFTSYTQEKIPLISTIPKQATFSKPFDKLVENMSKLSNKIALNNSTGDHESIVACELSQISKIHQEYLSSAELISKPIHKPPTSMLNATSASMTALGVFNIKNDKKIRSSDAGHALSLAFSSIQDISMRTNAKIAVLYVAQGKPMQDQILGVQIEETSPHFKEFINGLGWAVDLVTHVGYNGGLDMKQFATGKTSIYFADLMHEVMFHVAPLITTDDKDTKKIYKKRHVGNDHVTIVWCENPSDYDRYTIVSQFNQVHIIIYPLQTGLFRVVTKWKDEVSWFGPLRYPVIVSKKVLPSLVRETAISAQIAIICGQSAFTYPHNMRKEKMQRVIKQNIHKEEDRANLISQLMYLDCPDSL